MAKGSAISGSVTAAAPKHYTWSFPGAPVRVQLSLSVVERLERELLHAEEASGLLLGGTAGRTTEVLHCKAWIAPAQPSKADALAPDVVGYYRATRDDLRPNHTDVELITALFPKPHQVFLLIQLNKSGPPNAAFFFWLGPERFADFPFMEFPFHSALLNAEQNKAEAAPQKLAVVADASEPAARTGVRRGNLTSKVILWCLGILLVLCLSGAAVLVALKRFPVNGRTGSQPPTAHQAAPSSQDDLGLQAERHNGDVKLSWNRNSASVLNATSGMLSIEDGGASRKIVLDPLQVRNGSILYAPTSDQVQMQVTLFSTQGSTSESVLVILPKAGSPQQEAVVRRVAPPAPQLPPAAADSPAAKPNAAPAGPEGVQPPNRSAPAPPSANGGNNAADTTPPRVSGLTPVSVAPLPSVLAQLAGPPSPPQAPASGPTANPAPQQPAHLPEPAAGSPLELAISPSVATKKVLPAFPPELRGVALKPITVSVRVEIDETGKVKAARAVPSKGFVYPLMTQEAVQAARLWRFDPAKRGAKAIPSEVVLEFVFKP